MLVKQSVLACSSTELVQLNLNIQLLVRVIVQITIVITEYQKVLTTLTGTTLDEGSGVSTITFPPNWSDGVVTQAEEASTKVATT